MFIPLKLLLMNLRQDQHKRLNVLFISHLKHLRIFLIATYPLTPAHPEVLSPNDKHILSANYIQRIGTLLSILRQ